METIALVKQNILEIERLGHKIGLKESCREYCKPKKVWKKS